MVRGTGDNGLLLQKLGSDVEPGCSANYAALAAGSWHQVDYTDTVEGVRFERTVVKMFSVPLKLVRDANKAQAKAAKVAQDLIERGVRCGICPACFGDYVVKANKMVHHWFLRPGDGMIHGDCFGIGHAPFEVSCAGTEAYCVRLGNIREARAAERDGLDHVKRTQVRVATRRVRQYKLPEYKVINRGEDGFDKAIANLRRELDAKIRMLDTDITELSRRITTWAPAPFPRSIK